MGRQRTAGTFVGLFALPVALLAALLAGGLSAVAWPLSNMLPFGRHDVTRVAHGPQQLHRGVKVKVTGAVQGQLRPGTSALIALTFQNPNKHKVQMNRVRVKVTGIVAPNADAAHPCTSADFKVRQMPRPTRVRVPAKRTADLVALHVPIGAWPSLAMLNRPLNQDGCKSATVKLRFKARGLHR